MSFSEPRNPTFSFGLAPITWATRTIILINVGVLAGHLILDMVLSFTGLGAELIYEFGAFSTVNIARGFVWTPLTYMFMHSGIYHLFLNMLMLFFFGPEVERILGSRQFVRFYLLCGALGVFLNYLPELLWPTAMSASVVGASGAVMGVMVAFAMIDPERQVFIFPLPFPITSRALIFLLIFVNVMSVVGGGSNMSVATHFGGMIVGFAYMKVTPMLRKYLTAQRLKSRPRPPGKATDDDMDELGREIDNIFKLQDRDKKD